MITNILKWLATATLIVGTLINSLGYFPLGPIVLSVGGALWLIVAIRWREPALIVNNAVLTLAGIGGLIYSLTIAA